MVANESYREFAETLQREYEEDANVRFGEVPRTAFNNVTLPGKDGAEPERISAVGSGEVFDHLVREGYLNYAGEIQPKYAPDQLGFEQTFPQAVPEKYRDPATVAQITDQINRYVFRDRMVKPARVRQKLTVNDRVLDNDGFLISGTMSPNGRATSSNSIPRL